MAGGHSGVHGKKRNSGVNHPNELLVLESRRSSADVVTTTNDSSPSDEHYELASDQMLAMDDITSGRNQTSGRVEEVEVKSTNSSDDLVGLNGKEEDEVDTNSAFVLDVQSRKTGKKPKQLTGFNESKMYVDLRSDSENDEEKDVQTKDEISNEDKKKKKTRKRETHSLDGDHHHQRYSPATDIVDLHQSTESVTSDTGSGLRFVENGPLDTRLRTEEEKRRALELAFQANKLARVGQYDDAVRLLTQAIMINENDYRFFVNRSYCYDCLGNFKAALLDADRAILLNSEWPKGHYRKGRALAGLYMFKEAEASFLKVVALDPDAEDEIEPELVSIRIKAVSMIGINEEFAAFIASKFDRLAPAIAFAVKNALQYCLTADGNGKPLEVNTSMSTPAAQRVVVPIMSPATVPRQNMVQRRSLGGTPLDVPSTDHLFDGAIIERSRTPLNVSNVPTSSSSFGLLDAQMVDSQFCGRHSVHGLKDDLLSDSESYHGAPSPTPSLPNLDSYHQYRERRLSTGRAPSESSTKSGGSTPLVNKTGRSVSDAADSPESMSGTDVTNPFKWKALWIGNLSSSCPEKLLRTMFGQFGQLTYCSIHPVDKKPGTAFALVHYDNHDSPSRAMSEYQGGILRGVSANNTDPLMIRFRPSKEQKKSAGGKPGKEPLSVTSGGAVGKLLAEKVQLHECYYWRTTGCRRGSECIYSHIEKHRGVDFQPWMTGCDRHILSKHGPNGSPSAARSSSASKSSNKK